MNINTIYHGLALDVVKTFPSESIDCVITSPPYFQLRDYGFDQQWGLEKTYQEYLENLWSLMDEIKRVLKPTGSCWVNLGDTYNGNKRGNTSNKGYQENTVIDTFVKHKSPLPDKSLLLIPHRFAIGCIEPDWKLRDDLTEEERQYVLNELLIG